MRVPWQVWFMTTCCSLICISARPAKERTNQMFISRTKLSDLESSEGGYVFKDMPVDKYAELIEKSLNEEFRAAPASTVKNDFELLEHRTLEPEAEMLPAHYTGVKPPGVDHMEITFLEPEVLGSSHARTSVEKSKNAGGVARASGSGAKAEVSKAALESTKGEKGFEKAVDFERGLKDEVEKELKKNQYSEAAGKKKSHSETENHFKGHEDEAHGEKGGSFEIEGHRKKGHNAAGFHNVYHKDEYKKDADFYDNDHQGGKYKKHGRYDEKHVSAEGSYQKGGNHDAAFDEKESSKEGKAEKGVIKEEAKGHIGKNGYDGFFENFAEFARKAANVGSKKISFR